MSWQKRRQINRGLLGSHLCLVVLGLPEALHDLHCIDQPKPMPTAGRAPHPYHPCDLYTWGSYGELIGLRDKQMIDHALILGHTSWKLVALGGVRLDSRGNIKNDLSNIAEKAQE